MSKAIFLVGGGKGGVGKSLMSMALLDFLQAGGRELFLVETDTSVPDVFKAYQDEIAGELVNLDEREGWIELVNLVEDSAEGLGILGPVVPSPGLRRDLATLFHRDGRRLDVQRHEADRAEAHGADERLRDHAERSRQHTVRAEGIARDAQSVGEEREDR